MFSNSQKMIKIDQNMLELSQIVCQKYHFYISAFVGYIVWRGAQMFKKSLVKMCSYYHHHNSIPF